jgi:hypothetical protein
MPDQRIILATDSRLLSEMLNRILLKTDHLDVVKQVSNHENLPAVIQQQDAEWIILTLPADNKFPDWTDDYMEEHPFVKILTVSSDGSWVKMKWFDKREQDIPEPSLQELIHILEDSSNIEKVDFYREAK